MTNDEVESVGRAVRATCVKSLGASDEDIEQQAVAHVLAKYVARPQEEREAIARGIAKRLIAQRWRRQALFLRHARGLSPRQNDDRCDPSALVERAEAVRRYERELSEMSQRDQVLISLWAAGLTPRQIADSVGMTVNAANVARHRAVKVLRSRLQTD